MVDQLLVKQKVEKSMRQFNLFFFCFFKVEILEAFTGFETANKYKVSETFVCVPIVLSQNIIWTFFQVLNSVGQEVYKAKEDTDCCTRQVKNQFAKRIILIIIAPKFSLCSVAAQPVLLT